MDIVTGVVRAGAAPAGANHPALETDAESPALRTVARRDGRRPAGAIVEPARSGYTARMKHCPSCGSPATRWVFRRPMPLFLGWIKPYTAVRPFVCGSCGWRGWRYPPAPGERAAAPVPPPAPALSRRAVMAAASTADGRPNPLHIFPTEEAVVRVPAPVIVSRSGPAAAATETRLAQHSDLPRLAPAPRTPVRAGGVKPSRSRVWLSAAAVVTLLAVGALAVVTRGRLTGLSGGEASSGADPVTQAGPAAATPDAPRPADGRRPVTATSGTTQAQPARTPVQPRLRVRQAASRDRGRADAPTAPAPSARQPRAERRPAAPPPPTLAARPDQAQTAAPEAPARFQGTLVIESTPAGARVLLDRRAVGTTPLQLSDVLAGSHVVRLEADGYAPWSSVVRVVANEETRVNGQLRSPDR
jgi:hypothetical protein